MIQQTSLFAFAQIMDNPLELGHRQRKVYETIKSLGITTDKQISKTLNWPINTVTPRRGELVKLGLIQKCGATMNTQTHRPELLWGVLK